MSPTGWCPKNNFKFFFSAGRAGGVAAGRAGGVAAGRAGGVAAGRAGGVAAGRAGGGRRVGVALLTNRLVTSTGHPQLKTGHKILFYFITSIISVAMAPNAEDRQARAKAIVEAKKKAAAAAAAEDLQADDSDDEDRQPERPENPGLGAVADPRAVLAAAKGVALSQDQKGYYAMTRLGWHHVCDKKTVRLTPMSPPSAHWNVSLLAVCWDHGRQPHVPPQRHHRGAPHRRGMQLAVD
jgi:hypothetical protein